MVIMRNIQSFTNNKKVYFRGVAALALALLLALNTLFAALPGGRFEKVGAAEATYVDVAKFEVTGATTLNIQLAVPESPIMPTAAESLSTLPTFRVFVDGDEIYIDNPTYSPAASYSSGIFSYKLSCGGASTVTLYANTDTQITSFRLFNENSGSNVNLYSLSLKNIPDLAAIDVSETVDLKELTLYELSALTSLDVSGCSLSSLQITSSTPKPLTSLDCTGNNLTFRHIPSDVSGNSLYTPQGKVNIPAFTNAGGTIDLSSCHVEILQPDKSYFVTEYKWFDSEGNELSEGIRMTNNGIFSVDVSLTDKEILCRMTHDSFEGLTLETTPTKVIEDLAFYYSAESSPAEVTFTAFDENARIYADNIDITSTASIEPVGSDPTLYCYTLNVSDSDMLCVFSQVSVTDLAIACDTLTELNTANCKALETLTAEPLTSDSDIRLPLEELTLKQNTELASLTVRSASLRDINLWSCNKLETAEISDNLLSGITLPLQNKLTSLNLENNTFSAVNLSACTELTQLDLSGNKLKTLDLTKNTKLTSLDLSSCKLESVDLYNMGLFTQVDLSDNSLNHSTLPSEPITQTPACSDYDYKEQDPIAIDPIYRAGNTINLTKYSSGIPGDTMTYTIHILNSDGTETTASNTTGVFTITQDMSGHPFFFSISSEKFASEDILTTTAHVDVVETDEDTDRFVFSMDKAGPVSFSVVSDRPVHLLLSDGTLKKFEREDGDYSKPIEITGNTVEVKYENSDKTANVIQISSPGSITEIDLSRKADSTQGFVTGITVSYCPKLEVLDISTAQKTTGSERVSYLDVSENTNLTELYAANNSLYSLDLSKNKKLKTLDISNNAVSKTDLTANTALEELNCSGNGMIDIKLTVPGALKTVNCGNNALTFTALPGIDGGIFTYGSQADVKIPSSVKSGIGIDLSHVGAENYTWKNAATGAVITPKTASNGIFTFGDEHNGISAYCEMTSSEYPGLVIKTTQTNLIAKLVEFTDPVAVLYTSMTPGQNVSLTLSCNETVYIDWGDGDIASDKTGETVYYKAEDSLSGTAIKLYTAGKLTLLSATDMKITKASLSSATDLETLDLSGNLLETIDLSKNTKLKNVDISNNCFIVRNLPYFSDSTVNYSYSPQARYQLPSIKAVTGIVDLGDLYYNPATGKNSTLVWYKKGTTEDTILSPSRDYENLGSGKVKFNDSMINETVYCVAVHEKLDDFTASSRGMMTTEMKITSGGEFTMTDNTYMIYDIAIEEGSTCISSDGVIIAAGDLIKVKNPSNNTMLTFNSKRFGDSTSITTTALLAKVKTKLPSFDPSKNNHYIYDFSFLDNKGKPIRSFTGKATITLKYPTTAIADKYTDYTFYLFHYNESGIKAGTMDEIAVSASAGGLTFDANSFSPYILVYQSKSGNGGNGSGSGDGSGSGSGNGGGSNGSPNTGEDDGKGESPETGDDTTGKTVATIILWVSIASIALIAVLSLIAFIKKKNGRK